MYPVQAPVGALNVTTTLNRTAVSGTRSSHVRSASPTATALRSPFVSVPTVAPALVSHVRTTVKAVALMVSTSVWTSTTSCSSAVQSP